MPSASVEAPDDLAAGGFSGIADSGRQEDYPATSIRTSVGTKENVQIPAPTATF